jgi:hypothetical protein
VVEDTIVYRVRAGEAALAWLNAAVASGNDDSRPALCRTISVEFFQRGVQFVGCDGTMLFRAWTPYSDVGDFPAPQPDTDEQPEDAVVVRDANKFAIAFMRVVASAAQGDGPPAEMEITIDEDEDEAEPALGVEVSKYVLTLHALGQRLSCELFEGTYPAWRKLDLGIDAFELVDGLTVSPRIFGAVGKLKGVAGIDMSFRGERKAIDFVAVHGSTAHVRGFLMPMTRPDKERADAKEQDAA